MTKNLMGIPRSDELPPLREPQESLEDESSLPGPPPGLCPGSAELGGQVRSSTTLYLMRFTNIVLREKRINFDEKTQRKVGGNRQKLRENDAENSVRTLLCTS